MLGPSRKTSVDVSAVQEADQLEGIAQNFQPQSVIANPQSVITVKAFDFFNMLEFIQCVDDLQCFDELGKSFLDAWVAGDGIKVLQERLGIKNLQRSIP